MRTTIILEGELMGELKRRAAASGRTITSIIADALRESFARADAAGGRRGGKLPVSSRSGGLCEGVDLDDSGSLRERMER